MARLGVKAARQWLFEFDLPILQVEIEDQQRAIASLHQYKESSFSLCDACSFALMERLDIQYAFVYDDHFREYGLSVLIPELF